MSYKLVRNHNIYVTSRNTNRQSPSSVTFDLPDNTIYLDDVTSQRIKVTLLTFSLSSNWTEIDATNNIVSFTYLGTTIFITIPFGSYPFYDLANTITSLQTDIICCWNKPSNTFVFTSVTNDPITIHFPTESYNVLGFSQADDGTSGTTVTSTTPIVPRQNTELYVKLMNVSLGAENISLDNYTPDGSLTPSNILAVVPIISSPFMSMFYDNSTYMSQTGVYISNEMFQQLCIDVVDKYGKHATFIPDWSASFLVEILDIEDPDLEDMKSSLDSINDTLGKMLTLKVIGR